MRKKIFVFLILILSALNLTSCMNNGEKNSTEQISESKNIVEENKLKDEKKIIKWRIESDPSTLDPLNFGGQEGMQVVNNMFEGLTRIIDGVPELAAAEEYKVSEDGKVYTFKIRKDAKWSDGKSLTAKDFEFAWLNYLSPDLKKSYAQDFFIIEGAEDYYNGTGERDDVKIKAIDDSTLEVKLVNPLDSFLSTISYVTFYPSREDIATDLEGKWSIDPSVAVSNGPFKLSEYRVNEGITLEKNDEYWNTSNVKIDSIEIVFIEDASSALTAFQKGEIDVMKGVPADKIPELAASSKEFHSLPMRGTQYYIFNTINKPLDNVNVRRALSMAIDRSQLVNEVAPMGQDPARGLVGNLIHLSDGEEFVNVRENYPNVPEKADIEGARKALKEAGYPDGLGFPKLKMIVDKRGEHPQVAQALQQMWKENLNIDIEINQVESDAIADVRKSGEFDLARWGWSADYDDPYNYLQLLQSNSERNFGKYSNNEYDNLIKKGLNSHGNERDKAFLDAEKKGIGDDVAFLVIYSTSDPSMIREGLTGWDKSGFAHWYFGNADLNR